MSSTHGSLKRTRPAARSTGHDGRCGAAAAAAADADKAASEPVLHRIPPVFDADSRVLILGSFPSVQSRGEGFYYAHPQNRFWRVLAGVYGEETPESVPEKVRLLRSHGLALWDVIASCRIVGSSDSSVLDAVPNDLSRIFSAAPIGRVLIGGQTAARFYRRFDLPLGYPAPLVLPSTSPANAAWSLDRLIDAWRVGLLQDGTERSTEACIR